MHSEFIFYAQVIKADNLNDEMKELHRERIRSNPKSSAELSAAYIELPGWYRRYISKHQCLPKEVIVDRGAEFQSTYMASLTAHFGIDYSLRPASHPRYGSEVERFFGEFKQQWLSQRPGTLADYREARAVDGKFAPKHKAILKPIEIFSELKQFCNWRETKLRGDEFATSGVCQRSCRI